jgi:hypothetical protein
MKFLEELDRCCKTTYVRRFLKEADKEEVARGRKSLITRFYELVHEGIHEEGQIAIKLYGKGTLPSYAPFRTLKSRLRRIMADAFTLQQLRHPTYQSYDEAYKSGHRQLSVVRLMISEKCYTAARDIASQVFTRVRKFEIISVNQGLTDILASCYLGIFYNEELYLKYSALNQYYSKAAYDLSIVSHRYREVRNGIYAQRNSPSIIGQLAKKNEDEIRELGNKYSHVSHLSGMVISTLMTGAILRGDYLKAIEVSNAGVSSLLKCTGVSQKVLSILTLSMVDCAIKLGDYNMGKKQIRLAKKHIEPGTINDLKLSDYSILLGFRTGNFEYSYHNFAATSRRRINSILTIRHIEYWDILEAYLNFLIVAEEIKPRDNWQKIRGFRTTKFSNEVPSFSRNKQGANIQILIIQALFFIVRKKYDKMIDRTEALSAYCNRYLKDDDNLRNNCFFKMLLITIKCNFNRIQTEQKVAPTLNRLKKAKGDNNLNDVELIPYEVLWEIVVKHLVLHRKTKQQSKKRLKKSDIH